MRVLLIDDHTMLTEALAAALLTYADIRTVWHATSDATDLDATIGSLHPDVITVELATIDGTATERLHRLAARAPRCPLVVLTADHDVTHAVEAARAGADAWVPKQQPIPDLIAVLRGVVRGEGSYPPPLLGPVLRALREPNRAGHPLNTLTEREQEVLLCMIEGRSGAHIAGELGVAAETIRTHIRSILAKLEVHSRLEAVSIARAHGWTRKRPRQEHAVLPLPQPTLPQPRPHE